MTQYHVTSCQYGILDRSWKTLNDRRCRRIDLDFSPNDLDVERKLSLMTEKLHFQVRPPRVMLRVSRRRDEIHLLMSSYFSLIPISSGWYSFRQAFPTVHQKEVRLVDAGT